ncbi:hypothetical protein BLNAU_23923 [Blattamonas nauphoetae]|uniref:Uncharacterized protein n=1 Tax=Blattamonas nauphoetae TaxID=2049346 RepID=A0ABQ9WP85_9EUKA|nr:hypothetical protein BLNAU_23923 [Blattamonas nauphoetae]
MSQPQTQTIPLSLVADPNHFADPEFGSTEDSPSDEVPDPFTFKYNLVNVNEKYPGATSDSSSQKPPPNPQLTSGEHQIEVPLSFTVTDLYRELASTLGVSHVYITIQFPCTIPPARRLVDHPDLDFFDPKRDAEHKEWIETVGWSGYQYNPFAILESLLAYWPVEVGKPKPMQVVVLPLSSTPSPQTPNFEDDDTRMKRLRLMGCIYDLFFARENGRVISMSTLDSMFGDRKKVYIRNCWQEFQVGVRAHWEKFYSKKKFTDADLDLLRARYFPNQWFGPDDGEDEELWRSIQETPDWIARNGADVSPFPTLLNSTLIRDDGYKVICVNGQPGTGKSQMLLYLIHRMMRMYQTVAIVYVLPKMPVITILVDKSNRSNPFTILSHPSSLSETYFAKGYPVIRILDSENPFANSDMGSVFTVYAASPTQYDEHIQKLPHQLKSWQDHYPFWTRQEFYTMLHDLGMLGQEHWIRPVSVTTIIQLHPLVIRLLGAHGFLLPASSLPQLPPATSAGGTGTLYDGFQFEPDLNETELPEGMIPAQSATDQGEGQSRSLPPSDLVVCLNVIEVFGLSPRALSADLDTAFNRICKMFGKTGIKFGAEHSKVIMSTLAASHRKNKPVSVFTARLLATMTRIKAKKFLVDIGDSKIPGVLRGWNLEHKVNQELLRSHARFTLRSALPDTYPSYNCTFPNIERRATLSSRLKTGPFDSNVLYYESLNDSLTDKGQTAWTGIDSFIYFVNGNSIKLFAFQITVNKKHKTINPVLIESLKSKIKQQHENDLRKVVVDVFFAWVVRPEDVPTFVGRKDHFDPDTFNFYVGVVSVSDLLLNEFSGLDDPPPEREAIKNWTTNDDAFKQCFVMMNTLTVNPNEDAQPAPHTPGNQPQIHPPTGNADNQGVLIMEPLVPEKTQQEEEEEKEKEEERKKKRAARKDRPVPKKTPQEENEAREEMRRIRAERKDNPDSLPTSTKPKPVEKKIAKAEQKKAAKKEKKEKEDE